MKFGEDSLSTLGMESIEECRTGAILAGQFGALLKEVPPTGGLTHNAEHAELDKGGIGKRGVAVRIQGSW